MVLAFLLFSFFATSGGAPLRANTPYLAETKINEPIHILGRELPECLQLGHYRTTSQIAWSCLVTIFFCTWVAIHPNLPGPRDSTFHHLKRKVTIAILAIFAPETIAYFATEQLAGARRIKKEFNEKFNGGDNFERSLVYGIKRWWVVSPEEVRGKWTLTHGFFVQMGGFMMYHEGKPVQVLTFDRLLGAIERGEIDVPHIPEEDITDKSKGDALSKLVVVIQTTRFVAQCLGRWISHLPATELEVSTLAFAVLNAYIYAVWWSKPQNVLVPIRLEFKKGSSPSNSDPEHDDHSISSQLSSSRLARQSSGSLHNNEPLSTSAIDARSTSEDDQSEIRARPVIEVEFDKESAHWMRRKFDKLPLHSGSPFKQIWYFCLHLPIILGIIVLYPFCLVEKTMSNRQSKPAQGNPQSKFRVGKSRVPMFYADDENFGDSVGLLLFSLLILPLIFGGIHVTLWSTSFYTLLDQLLWKISTVHITIAPLLSFSMGFLVTSLDLPDTLVNKDMLVSSVSLSPLLLYPIARGILIFISLYALIHLPEGAHHEVQWANLLPYL